MKKIILALVLVFVLAAPMFAADPTIQVATKIEPITQIGFTAGEYTDETANFTAITDDQKLSAGKASFYASVRTNKSEGIKITVTHTDLINTDDSEQTIGLTLTNAVNKSLTFTETGALKGLRAYSQALAFEWNKTDADAASAGTYKSTVTMTVASGV